MVVNWLKNWCPPQLKEWLMASKNVQFQGSFSSFAEAKSCSDGYESNVIVERALAATKAVMAGEYAYERDTVCFRDFEPDFNFLAPFLLSQRKIVVDFGGALGSLFFRHKELLLMNGLHEYRVVEQANFVEAGNALAVDNLKFYDNLAPALKGQVDLVVLSSVLGYVDNPQEVLSTIAQAKVEYIYIDRTLFGQPRIAIEKTPVQLGGASYPVQIFDQESLLEPLMSEYKLLYKFNALEGEVRLRKPTGKAYAYGMLLQRVQTNEI